MFGDLFKLLIFAAIYTELLALILILKMNSGNLHRAIWCGVKKEFLLEMKHIL